MSEKRKAIYNPEADRKWREKNKKHNKYLKYRSFARSFLRSLATLEDLEEMERIIALRRDAYPCTLDAKNKPIDE